MSEEIPFPVGWNDNNTPVLLGEHCTPDVGGKPIKVRLDDLRRYDPMIHDSPLMSQSPADYRVFGEGENTGI